MIRALPFFVFSLFLVNANASDLVALDQKTFEKYSDEKAIIILHINWGRMWGCAKVENAQLMEMSFTRINDSGAESPASLEFETPSKLSPKDGFRPYELVIDPGVYALSGFRVKVAKSVSDVGYLQANEDHLVKNGKPIGGSFEAGKGEIVYLGHIGLDCAVEPIPWRYYVEGKDQFKGYTAELAEYFPYLKGRKLMFRLLETTKFGQPYCLGRNYGVQM